MIPNNCNLGVSDSYVTKNTLVRRGLTLYIANNGSLTYLLNKYREWIADAFPMHQGCLGDVFAKHWQSEINLG